MASETDYKNYKENFEYVKINGVEILGPRSKESLIEAIYRYEWLIENNKKDLEEYKDDPEIMVIAEKRASSYKNGLSSLNKDLQKGNYIGGIKRLNKHNDFSIVDDLDF